MSRSSLCRFATALMLSAACSLGASAQQADPKPDPPGAAQSTPPAEESQQDPGAGVDDPASAGPPAPQHLVLEGQVIDAIGRGDSSVTVTVHRRGSNDKRGELIAVTATDDLGDFKVFAPRPVKGVVVVTFAKPNFQDLVREVTVGEEEWPPYLAEQLQGKLSLAGRVEDARTEKQVDGASVILEASYNEWNAKTDSDGRFEIKGLAPGRGRLVVEAQGFGRQVQDIDDIAAAGELAIQLKTERVVHLLIEDDGGKPIGGATIECLDEPRDDFRTTVTDADGKATLRGLHFDANTLGVRLTHEDYVSSVGFGQQIVTPADESESAHTLVMRRAGRVAGIVKAVVEKLTEPRPVNGARVIAGSVYRDDSPRNWTDDRGEYEIRGVEPGTTAVTVHLRGYAPALRTVEVLPGETASADFVLEPGSLLVGVVRNEAGEPIPGAMVDTGKWHGHETLGLRAMTGPDGTFAIADVPSGEIELIISARGASRLVTTAVAGGTEPLTLTLAGALPGGPDAVVRVKVDDPAPSFSVTLMDGKPLALQDLQGKIVVLDFWATWCGPCVADLPRLIDLFDKFGQRRDFALVGVSLDFDKELLREFLQSKKMGWSQVFGDDAQALADRYGVRGLPALFVIRGDGTVAAVDSPADKIAEVVGGFLSEARAGREAAKQGTP